MRRVLRLGVIFLSVMVLLNAGCDSIPGLEAGDSGLSASGVVETVEVAVAPELGGRVEEIFVDEGDAVEEGEMLFRLGDELLQSRRQTAVTTLEAAQANLVTAQTSLEMAEANKETAEKQLETAEAEARIELLAAQKALDDLIENHEVSKAQAQQAVAAATRSLREAKYLLYNFTVPVDQKDMTAMQGIEVMGEKLDRARDAFEPYRYHPSGDNTREELKDDLDQAQSDYDAAVRRLEYETAASQAQASLDKAIQDLETLQDGPNPDEVAVLEARITAAQISPEQAEALVAQAEVGLDQAQAAIDQGRKTVDQAKAALETIDVQIDKLDVKAPVPGVILVRNIEPGEVLQAGATALIIGQLDKLTITVFVPEDRYGQVKLGDRVQVTADSFPGQEFEATVVRIADRAEYTPRNVQTKEDRATTVFAIKLIVKDPDGKLKPGMPVDVSF